MYRRGSLRVYEDIFKFLNLFNQNWRGYRGYLVCFMGVKHCTLYPSILRKEYITLGVIPTNSGLPKQIPSKHNDEFCWSKFQPFLWSYNITSSRLNSSPAKSRLYNRWHGYWCYVEAWRDNTIIPIQCCHIYQNKLANRFGILVDFGGVHF